MPSFDMSTKALRTGMITFIVLLLMGGMFFLGTRFGNYQSYLQMSRFIEKNDQVESLQGVTTPAHLFVDERYGAKGEIISVATGSLIVRDSKGHETTITLTAQTSIQDQGEKLAAADMHTGDTILVFGSSMKTGVLGARIIRMLGHGVIDIYEPLDASGDLLN